VGVEINNNKNENIWESGTRGRGTTTTTDSTFEDNYKMGEIARDWQNTASSEKKRKKPPNKTKTN